MFCGDCHSHPIFTRDYTRNILQSSTTFHIHSSIESIISPSPTPPLNGDSDYETNCDKDTNIKSACALLTAGQAAKPRE